MRRPWWGRMLPLRVDRLEVDFSGRIAESGGSNETQPIHRDAGRLDLEGGRRWGVGEGHLPAPWNRLGDVVPVEVEVRGMGASELRRTKELEAELGQMKRMYADLALENRALKDLIDRKL